MNPEEPGPNRGTVARIPIPPAVPPSAAEIERRRALAARVDALREKIGPIGIAVDELIHQVRMEADGIDDE